MFKSSRVLTAAGLLAVGALTITGCSSNGSGGGGDDNGDIALGFTATLTGDFASYGIAMRQAIELAIEEVNADGGVDGRNITLEAEDDQGQPSNGPIVAQQFCDSDVSAILGYSFSSVALAAAPVFDQCGIPVVASAVTSPALSGVGDNFFRNIPTDAAQGAQMGAYTVEELGLTKIAVLNQQDDFGVGTSDSFIKGVEEAGGEVSYREAYQVGTSDFQTQVGSIANSDAEALYIGGFYTEAAKIAQQARAAGFEGQILGTDGALAPDLVTLAGDAVEGMILYGAFVPTIDTPVVQDFVKAYTDKYGEEPTSAAALAYDALHLVVEVMKSEGTDRESIASALPTATLADGVTGENAFNEEHDRVANVIFLTVQDGTFVQYEK